MRKTGKLLKGFPTERIILSSNYTSTQAACDDLIAKGDWFDEVDAESAVCTANIGDKNIVVGSGSLKTDGVLLVGDIWSPNGTDWYNVESVPDDTTITLTCALQDANISGVAARIGKPKYRKLIIDSTDNLDTLLFTGMGGAPAFVNIQNSAGGVFRNQGDIVIIEPPLQGVIVNNNIIIDTVESDTVNSHAMTGATGTHETVHYEEHFCSYTIQGIDLFDPSSSFGSVILSNGYYEGNQDMLLCVPHGKFKIYDTTIVGRSRTFGESGVYLIPNMFASLPHVMQRSTLRLDHRAGVPISTAFMCNTASIPLDGAASVWDDMRFEFIAANASEFSLIGNYTGGLTTTIDLTLNSPVFDTTAVTTGTVDIVETEVWDGGSLIMNSPDKTGTADGGGGTFTVTTNP